MRNNSLFSIVCATLMSGFAFVSCNKSLSTIPVEEVQDKHFVDALSDSYTYLVLDDSSVDAMVGEITEVLVDDDLIFISHIPNAGGSYMTGRAQNEYV